MITSDRTESSRRRLVGAAALLAALGASLLGAGAASATTNVTFTIQNPSGTPQFSYVIDEPSGHAAPTASDWLNASYTSVPGQITIQVSPGDTVYFNRTSTPYADNGALVPPEGVSGVSYPVPASPPSTVTITMPSTGSPYHPELSGAERWMLGQINQRRAALNAPPLVFSTTLSAAASEEARDEAVNHRWPHPFFFVIPQDLGWPGDIANDYTTADAPFSDPQRVLVHWDGDTSDSESPQIWNQLKDPNLHYVGIGDGAGAWNVLATDSCPSTNDASACGTTTDTGDTNAWSPTQIAIRTPSAGSTYTQGQSIAADYSCTVPSNGAALASGGCAGTAGEGQPIDTSSAGTKTFTVTATDVNGDTTTSSVQYTVQPASGGGSIGTTSASPPPAPSPPYTPEASRLRASYQDPSDPGTSVDFLTGRTDGFGGTTDGAGFFVSPAHPHFAVGDQIFALGTCADPGSPPHDCFFHEFAPHGIYDFQSDSDGSFTGSSGVSGLNAKAEFEAVDPGEHSLDLASHDPSNHQLTVLELQYTVDPAPPPPAQTAEDGAALGSGTATGSAPVCGGFITICHTLYDAQGNAVAIIATDAFGNSATLYPINGAQVINAGGANVINAGGANVVAVGGANLFELVSASGQVVAVGGANVISNASSTLISDKGLGLISDKGLGIISDAGDIPGLISDKGLGLVGNGAALVLEKRAGRRLAARPLLLAKRARLGSSAPAAFVVRFRSPFATAGRLTSSAGSAQRSGSRARRLVGLATGRSVVTAHGASGSVVMLFNGQGRRLLARIALVNAARKRHRQRLQSLALKVTTTFTPVTHVRAVTRTRTIRLTPVAATKPARKKPARRRRNG